MIQLTLETSSRKPSIALCRDEWLLGMRTLHGHHATSQQLIPQISQLLREHGLEPRHISLVTVSVGPGSFTGLRIGVTTAKTIAYAVPCALTAVDSLDVVAHQLVWNDDPDVARDLSNCRQICAVADAQRRQWYAAFYELPKPSSHTSPEMTAGSSAPLATTRSTHIVDADQLVKSITIPTIISGSGLLNRPVDSKWVIAADPGLWLPRADTTARLGRLAWQSQNLTPPFELAPKYHRPSAAEEKLGAVNP